MSKAIGTAATCPVELASLFWRCPLCLCRTNPPSDVTELRLSPLPSPCSACKKRMDGLQPLSPAEASRIAEEDVQVTAAAEALERSGDLRGALSAYLDLLRRHPEAKGALNNAAVLHLQMSQASEALRLAEKAVALSPNYVKAWNTVGVAKAQLRDAVGAVDAWTRAVLLDPVDAKSQANLVGFFHNRAMEEVGQLAASSGGNITLSGVLSVLTKAHVNEGWPAASSFIRTSREYHHIPAGKALGKWTQFRMERCLRRGDPSGAIAICQKFIGRHKDSAQGLNWIGHLYLQAGQIKQALDVLHRATRVDPGAMESWNNLGWALKKRGDNVEAKAAFRKALCCDPGCRSALNGYYDACYHSGDPSAALLGLGHLVLLEPDKLKHWQSLGGIAVNSGFSLTAQWAYSRALQLDPTDRISQDGMQMARAVISQGAPNRIP